MSKKQQPDYDKEMKLPEGKTCHDCAHYQRCAWLVERSNEALCGSCDWWPSRFVPIPGAAQ